MSLFHNVIFYQGPWEDAFKYYIRAMSEDLINNRLNGWTRGGDNKEPALLECLGTMLASPILSYEVIGWKTFKIFITRAQIQRNISKLFIFSIPHQEVLDRKLTMILLEILSPQLFTLFWVHLPLQGARSFWSIHTSLFLIVEQSFKPLSFLPQRPNISRSCSGVTAENEFGLPRDLVAVLLDFTPHLPWWVS